MIDITLVLWIVCLVFSVFSVNCLIYIVYKKCYKSNTQELEQNLAIENNREDLSGDDEDYIETNV
jgi:hypothetical protein